jgi:23S rRNA-/tRNA-specific pseudouridylate synthase
MQKVYHTIVVSDPERDRATIDAKLLRILDAKNEAKVRVDVS